MSAFPNGLDAWSRAASGAELLEVLDVASRELRQRQNGEAVTQTVTEPPEDAPNVLNAKEAADFLKVTTGRLYALVRENRIPGVVRLGKRQYRFDRVVLEGFLRNGGEASQTG